MARRYEYIIHGPPLPATVQTIPRKALHSRRDSQKTTNLRSLYRNSASPTQDPVTIESLQNVHKSSPTTPKLPPTPPVADEQDGVVQEQLPAHEVEAARLHSMRATPVNQNTPPTPEDTPPRNTLKAPIRPFLAMRPSFASTRADSFRTAHEHLHSDDDFGRSTLTLHSAVASQEPVLELPPMTDLDHSNDQDAGYAQLPDRPPNLVLRSDSPARMDEVDGNTTLPAMPSLGDDVYASGEMARDTPETQFRFAHLKDNTTSTFAESLDIEDEKSHEAHMDIARFPSVHELVTASLGGDPPKREKSLRDRLHESNQIPITASTEAFANVIGWNDGAHSVTQTDSENRSNRWSGNSNPSAVEAYVVDSPIKPQKRGTLRKVIKNGSLRAVSSPIPDSKRASLQSNSDSSHRLVHKKAKLTNQNRWSTGSDISRRSLSLNSPSPWPKTEIITVAIIPEKGDSFHTSASSSRRQSRSISTGSGHNRQVMSTVSTPTPRRKRAFSDSIERTPVNDRPAPPVQDSSLSTPTPGSGSRANSASSENVSLQRRQAEKDLRITLDRMESERLSSSLRRVSLQSSSPAPAAKPADNPTEEVAVKPSDTLPRRISSAGNSTRSGPRYSSVGFNGITPGTKEWAELRPPTVSGTPFSQTSMASASPEIIEAKVVSFFPHHNESLQIIEPNRLSESQAVRTLRDQPLGRSNTVPAMKISTSRTSDNVIPADVVDSPLRNPRKPPDPPHFEITPATPLSELNRQLANTPDPNSAMSRTTTVVRDRPTLPGRDRSESFMKQLTRNFSTRNAKNPKADQELDGTQNPFWRPRAFWDDAEYVQRIHQDQERDLITETIETTTMPDSGTMRTVTILERPIKRRSNTITTGPVSLVRKISERKRQRKVVDDHLAQQQALVKQTSYSSLQKFRAGRRLYGMPPMRSLSLNVGMGKLRGLQDKMVIARAKREDSRREKKRDALRKSIGAEVVSQGDSRFVNGATTTRTYDPTEEMLQNARSQELLQKIQERDSRL